MDWEERNCFRCRKSYDEDTNQYRCDIDKALTVACVDDGSVSDDIARRMGYPAAGPLSYTWDCPERELE